MSGGRLRRYCKAAHRRRHAASVSASRADPRGAKALTHATHLPALIGAGNAQGDQGVIRRWQRLGRDLSFGIGIAHDHATLGTIDFEGRFDYAAIGTVSNVCDEARPDQILISSRVLLAVEDAVSAELAGDFILKSIGRPMAAYNVIEPLAGRSGYQVTVSSLVVFRESGEPLAATASAEDI